MQRVLITGATSGIGKALTGLLLDKGVFVVATGRHIDKIKELNKYDNVVIAYLDVTSENCCNILMKLAAEYDVDTIVLNAGGGYVNHELDENKELFAVNVNVAGFTKCALASYKYLRKRGGGLLAGVSSVAGTRGIRHAPAYNASKSYVISYLESLRHKATKEKTNIQITDIRPGFVKTPLISGESGNYAFGVTEVDKAAMLIYKALQRRKSVVYIPWWWKVVAMIMKLAPRKIYYKV